MNNKNNIKTIFCQYKIYKFKLENNKNNILYINSTNEKTEENDLKKIENWKKYTNCVDNILKNIPKESSYLLKKIYIENVDRREFNYSDSTFYWKQKKAIKDFLLFLRD